MNIPEELKERVPKDTPYCYTLLRIDKDPIKGFIMRTKPCPFYESVDMNFGGCNLTCEIVDDQCKICGISEGLDEIHIE